MLKYFQTVMVGCLLLSGVSVSFAGDSDEAMQRMLGDTDISSKFSKLENTTVYRYASVRYPYVKTACFSAGKEKKIKYRDNMLIQSCNKEYSQEENINDCMKKCDNQVNEGDRCIGLEWVESSKNCTLFRYMLAGTEEENSTRVYYIHKDRATRWDEDKTSSWAWSKGLPSNFPDLSSEAGKILAYDNVLGDVYLPKINSIFGLFVEIKNVDLVKKKKDYYLQRSRGSDANSFKACEKEFKTLITYLPQSDKDKGILKEKKGILSVKCEECDGIYKGTRSERIRKVEEARSQNKSEQEIQKILKKMKINYLYTHRVDDYLNEKYGDTKKGDNP